MKRLTPLLMVCVLVCALAKSAAGAAGPTAGESFYLKKLREADQAYLAQNFEQARDVYLELREMEIVDPVLFGKLGNTYAQLGLPGHAVLMYRRALRLAPRNAAIRYNLHLIEPPENRRQPFVLLVPFRNLRDFLALDEWAWLTAVLWCVTAAALVLTLFIETGFAAFLCKRLAWGAGGSLLFALLMLGARYRTDEALRRGVVLESVVTRFGPGAQFKEHLELPAGRCVRVISTSEEWTEITVPGESGASYVQSAKLGKI